MNVPQKVFYQVLGKSIAEERMGCGLTQKDLAESLSLGRTSLANIEVGRQRISAYDLAKISNKLGVDVSILLPI